MPPNGTNKSFIVPERPLIKELGTVTKGRDYSGAGLLLGIRGPTNCAVSVGIRQCISGRRQSDELWTDADRDTRVATVGRSSPPEFKAHQMKG